MRNFTKIIDEKIYITEKIALRKLPEDCYKNDLSFEEMEKKMKEIKILKKNEDSIINKGKKITNNKEISIFVKIFAYIIILIQNEQEEYNIINRKDVNFNKFIIDDFLIYIEERESIETKNVKFAKKINKIQSVIKLEKEEVKKEDDINKYHFELKKYYQCSFQKWPPFFIKNLMEKEIKLGFCKNAYTKIKFSNDSHQNYFYFNKPKIEKIYNLDIILTCNKHSDQKKYDFSCKQCLDHFYYFYNTYIIVYDLLVKYLYLPYKLSYIEKQHYVAFYIYKILPCWGNKSKINNSTIFDFKIEELKSKLQGIYDIEKIDLSFDFLKRLEEISSQENSINQKKKNDPKDKFSLKKLYTKFVVWNTVYLILLKKFPHFTKELKKKSLTNELINKYKQKYGKDTFFEKFFLEINNISNDDNKMNKNKIKIGELNHKLRNYLTKYNLKIENFSFYNKSFYEVDDKFLIDNENNINIIEETIPHFVYFKTKVPYIKDEFRLLMDLWNSFDKNTDQFYIFFGYNKLLIY